MTPSSPGGVLPLIEPFIAGTVRVGGERCEPVVCLGVRRFMDYDGARPRAFWTRVEAEAFDL
jgi:hypothetical protein